MNKEVIGKLYFKYRFYIFPAVSALCCLILIIFVIYPQVTQVIKSFDDLQQKENKLHVLKVKTADLEELNEAELTQKLNAMLVVLPEDKDYPSLIGVLRSLTSRFGVLLSSLQIGKVSSPAKAETGSAFAVTLEFSGSKALVSRLITALESSNRIMKIRSMDLSFNKTTDAINASFMLDVFFAPIPTNIGSYETPLPKLTQKDQEMIASLTRDINKPVSLPISSSSATTVTRGKINPFE